MMSLMIITKLLILAGILFIIFGLIFHLQGQSILGPESSFMYSNPEWITYGLEIIILGFLIVISGVILGILKRN